MEISRKTITIILAVLLIALGILSHYTLELAGDRDSYEALYHYQQDSAKIWRNKAGLSQAEAHTAKVTVAILKAEHSAQLDTLQKQIRGLKKNLSNLQSHTSVSSTTSGTFIAPAIDTSFTLVLGQSAVKAKSFAYSDKWTSMNGYFLRDSVHVEYKIRDDIDVVQYWKRPGIFKPLNLYTDVISHNPHSEITALKSLSVRPPVRSKLGLDVFTGYAPGAGLVVGIGVGYRLIQF